MAKDQTKFDKLLAAALSGNRAAVDRVLSEEDFTMGEYFAMPGQFNALPTQTKAELAGVYRTNPNIVPDQARPFVESAIQGVTPVARATAPAPVMGKTMTGVPTPRLRPVGAARATPKPTVAATVQKVAHSLSGLTGRSTKGVDPRLVSVLTAAAAEFKLPVVVKSAFRPGDTRQHGKARAVDINIIGPDGKVIPDYQNGSGFRTYEQFAQVVRTKQQQMYPELDSALRWGGYFSGKKNYGALDAMHFDLGGLSGLGMLGGSWEGGLNAEQRRYYPTAVSIGMGDVDMMRLNKLGYVGPDAVERYQADRGLEVDGIIGKNTRALLAEDAAAPVPPMDIPNPGLKPVADPALGARAASELQGYDGTPVVQPKDALSREEFAARFGEDGKRIDAPNPNLRPASDITRVVDRVLTQGGRLRKGASGEDVKQLQQFLNRRGVTDDKGRPIATDGKFGRLTRQAVENYQARSPDLRQDGVVGPRTIAKMLRDAQAENPYRQGMEGSPELASAAAAGDPVAAAVLAATGTPGTVPMTPAGVPAIPGLTTLETNPFGSTTAPVPLAAWGIGADMASAITGRGAYPETRFYVARRAYDEAMGGAPLRSRPAADLTAPDLSFAAPPAEDGARVSLAYLNPDMLEAQNELFLPYDGATLGRSLGAISQPARGTVNNTGAALYNATSSFARTVQQQKQNQKKQEITAAYQAYKAQPSQVFGDLTPAEFAARFSGESGSGGGLSNYSYKSGVNTIGNAAKTSGAMKQPGSGSSTYTNPYKSNAATNAATGTKVQPSTKSNTATNKTSGTKAGSTTSSLRTDAAGRVLGGI